MRATDEEINAAIALLRAEGFVVEMPNLGPWEKAIDLWKRAGQHLCYGGFFKRLNSFPGDYPKEHGATGRVKRLRATPELVAWIGRAPEPGKRRHRGNTL